MPETVEKVVLVTGGTGGIGRAIAAGLAQRGATVVITGRDAERGRTAVSQIQKSTGNQSVGLLLADLSSLEGVRTVAREFLGQYGRLDVLVNNVGALYGKRHETVDGLEATLAINHLCPFLLTHLLLPLLKARGSARIVNLNSEGHRSAKTVDFDSLRPDRWKRGFLIYGQSKLAGLLFTYEMARRLEGTGITVNAVHPGMVFTDLSKNFVSEKFGGAGRLGKAAGAVVTKIGLLIYNYVSEETAAEVPIYLAWSDEVAGISGKYFDDRKQVRQTSPASYDAELSKRIWKLSAELVGLERPAAVGAHSAG